MALNKIVVFCGYSAGSEPECLQAVEAMDNSLALRGITMVFGGAGLACWAYWHARRSKLAGL